MKRNTDKTDELAECCKFKAKRCKPSSTFQVKRLCPGSKVPTRGSKGSAGWDLYACIDRLVSKRSNGSPVKSFGEKILVDSRKAVRVAPHGKALIDTGCAYAIEPGYYGRIAPRSSLAWKNHIDVGAGVIDSDYRGEVKVVLFNHSSTETVIIHDGDRIAQIIFTPCATEELTEVVDFTETERGTGGFGSTGK